MAAPIHGVQDSTPAQLAYRCWCRGCLFQVVCSLVFPLTEQLFDVLGIQALV